MTSGERGTVIKLHADLVLMPHAWPTPAKAGGPVTDKDVADQQRRMTELPVLYARALGVPVVFANQVGPLAPGPQGGDTE